MDFAAVFRHLPTAYLVMDPQLRIVAANDAYLDLLGRTREQLVGRPVFEAFPPGPDALDEDGRNPLQLSFERARDTGRPDQMPLFDYAVADADAGLQQRCWSLISSAVPDGDGSTALVLQRVEDVTDYVVDRQDRKGRRDRNALSQAEQTLLWRRRVEVAEADLFARAQELRTALEAQEVASRRLAGLAEAALQLASVDSFADLAEVVLATGLAALGSDGGAIGVREEEHDLLRVDVTRSLGAEARERLHELPLTDPLPLSWAARTGRDVLLPDRDAGLAWSPAMQEVYDITGRQAWAVLPLRVGDRLLGSLAAAWTDPHQFGADEADLLAAFAAQCAQALDRLRVRQAERAAAEVSRELSEALQLSLLSEPPVSPGLAMAVRYRSASDGAQVGGDWYDAFVTGSGETTVVVGDVTGHDRSAAAAMAQLRNVLRGVAQAVPDSPARVLTALDRTLRNLHVDSLATAVLAQVRCDPAREPGRDGSYLVQWSNAGHPPPLLLRPDGSSVLLDAEPDLLLGLQPGFPRVDHHVRLPAGSTLLLFTDGLFERRGESLDVGLERLRRATERHAGLSADELCEALLAELDEPLGDDVALLVVSTQPLPPDCTAALPDRLPVHPPGASRSLVLPADPAVVRRARDLVQDMCSTAGVDEDTCQTAVLLTSETVTNAIMHARSDATLTVSAGPGVVRVEVGDDDSRRPLVAGRDPQALGGRGMEIVQLLAQRWGVRDEPRGKVVWFELGDG